MPPKKASDWIRTFDIMVGLLTVILSVYVLIYPGLAVKTVIVILSIAFISIGIARIFVGFIAEKLSDKLRVVNILVGLILFLMSILVIMYNELTVIVLIFFLSISLLLNGVARIVLGGAIVEFPGFLRGLLILVGVMSIGLSFLIFISPGLGAVTLVFYLSIVLLFNGITRIVRGIVGKKI